MLYIIRELIIYHKICSDVGTRRFLFIKHSIKSQIPKTRDIVSCVAFADHRKKEKKRIRMSGPQCCSNPPTLNPNAGAGHVEQLGGLSTYVSGSPNSKLAILLISDVYGAHTFLWHFSFFCLLLWCALIFTSNCDLGVGFWLVRIPLGGCLDSF